MQCQTQHKTSTHFQLQIQIFPEVHRTGCHCFCTHILTAEHGSCSRTAKMSRNQRECPSRSTSSLERSGWHSSPAIHPCTESSEQGSTSATHSTATSLKATVTWNTKHTSAYPGGSHTARKEDTKRLPRV